MQKQKVKQRRLPPDATARLLEALGGTSAVAGICGIRPQSVSEWRTCGMPRPWVLFLRERFSTLPVMKEVREF